VSKHAIINKNIAMIKFLLNLFSPYAHPFEKKVDKFFRQIKSNSDQYKIQKELETLMQKDLVILDLWMEKKYKSYKYMKKSVRRKMHEDVKVLNKEFDQYAESHKVNVAALQEQIESHGLDFPENKKNKLTYIAAIMSYLRPGTHYRYEKAANFGKLLKNPREEKLIGDCNQIVTLYSYMYSRKYPISDLNIKLLPGHVCLHFEGIDIEATNGTFQHYKEHDGVLPITELITTNLLDVVDAEEKVETIDPRTMVKRAQFAYAISSKKDLVKRNLDIAYRNVGITLVKRKEFKSAIYFFEKLGDRDLIKTAYHNATIHYLNAKNYKSASYYARRTGEPELENAVTRGQGVNFYNKKNYKTALTYFQKINDDRMIKACYQGQYSQLAAKIKNVKTIDDARKYRSTYNAMLDLAHKMGNEQAANYVRGISGKM